MSRPPATARMPSFWLVGVPFESAEPAAPARAADIELVTLVEPTQGQYISTEEMAVPLDVPPTTKIFAL